MSRFILPFILASLVAGPTLADEHQEQDSAQLTQKLAGVWNIAGGKNQGENLTGEELAGRVIIAKDEIVTYDKEKKELYRAKFTLDASTQPVQIMMTSTMNGRTAKALGILKMNSEGDQLWLCYGLPGSPRPKEFASPGDSQNMLFELQRATASP